ncbi:aldo-keto reductase family 4 protein [Pycnococcus provasolii]|eukprot:CAMPEP_0119197852 /NCGR_PEP_ID=MMETSP1316-20130426/15842_1 /TAXON_ID=41880 /ORGANISM="Pycnococcus provasolii, Strain RCC2336" /LENGTH=327 /DNA_ID=CAMNT_0007193697 /DNA_START=162 /DNA_END=1145 /DNA_ORIENTATION=+
MDPSNGDVTREFRMRNASNHPAVGFGTYKCGYLPPSSAQAQTEGDANPAGAGPSASTIVASALDVGYRFLDCAQFYNNEADVGIGIQNSGVPRSELFLASKCWTTAIAEGPSAVRSALCDTLDALKTDYVDLYCIHWPVPHGRHVVAYKELLKMRNEGLIRSVGVSNYTLEDYDELVTNDVAEDDLPLVNQIEVNPLLYRKKTIEEFQRRGVLIQSYRSLRDGKAFEIPTIVDVANKHGRTAAQVMGRWLVQKNIVYIPKSVRRDRMEENIDVFDDFELDDEDVTKLDHLTTDDALETFAQLYRKCVVRDTQWDGTTDGVRTTFTIH